jgi:hypothetical protein
MRIFPLLGATLLAGGTFMSCGTPSFGVTPRLGTLDIDGDIGVESTGVTAKNSVESLGLVEDDSVFSGRVDFDWGGVHVTAAGQSSTHDGDGVLEADISQGGTTITAGTAVESKLDIGIYSGVVTFDLLPTDNFELGLGLGVAAIDFDVSFTDPNTSDRIATDETVPLPVIALRGAVAFGPVDVSVLANGMAVAIDGDEATYIDIDAMARVRVLGSDDRFTGWITLGWRQIDLDAEYEDDGEAELDLEFSGPYFGLTFAF